ncbi:unnamed protein product [Caenorhabditis auriculariae]|uniref:Uncharacterized protein n=1 Tax=Caenorhabditis auriculariae TaxID=2777116 RepID=A0A8S1GS81_9PELO|nr:unnamed protein product [Caenorhabditis auriculariae]
MAFCVSNLPRLAAMGSSKARLKRQLVYVFGILFCAISRAKVEESTERPTEINALPSPVHNAAHPNENLPNPQKTQIPTAPKTSEKKHSKDKRSKTA